MLRTIAALIMVAAGLAACQDEPTDPNDERAGVFVIQVVDEQFRVRIDDPVTARQARALISSGQSKNINGGIARGNGGFNSGYGWHLVPGTIAFVDLSIELCDGLPSYVEAHIDYFVDTVRQYCPWGVQVLSEVTPQ